MAELLSQEQNPPKFKFDVSLSIVMFMVALVLDEKTLPFVIGRIVVITIAGYYPTRHLSSYLSERSKAKYRRMVVWLVFCCSIALIGLYGWHIWPRVSYDITTLRLMSTEELKEGERKLADQMREYQTGYENKFEAMIAKQGQTQDLDLQISHVAYNFRDDFHRNLSGKACAVRDEFLWRLGKTPDQAENDVIANLPSRYRTLEDISRISRALAGDFTGPHPVGDAADFMDGLARLLN